jgi:histidinol phosphatase-like PHP family hydrolase
MPFKVADHRTSWGAARRGLSVEEIAQQHRAVDKLNKTFGKDFRIFKGIESDILADGSLDYPDDSADLPGQVRAMRCLRSTRCGNSLRSAG